MKKTVAMFAGVLVAATLSAQSGLKALSVTMSTEGPDCYADGTPVEVGETYLLVYVGEGAVFGGVYMDGTLADINNNALVGSSVAVEGSKCGFKVFQYPAGMYPAGGVFMIVLLDTRDATGTVGSVVAWQGAVAAGTALSEDAVQAPTALRVTGGSGDVSALATVERSAVPETTPRPIISGLTARDGAVEVRIKNVVDTVNYEVQSTEDLSSGTWQPVAGAERVTASLNALPGGEELRATLTGQPQKKVRFYRVVVPGQVK